MPAPVAAFLFLISFFFQTFFQLFFLLFSHCHSERPAILDCRSSALCPDLSRAPGHSPVPAPLSLPMPSRRCCALSFIPPCGTSVGVFTLTRVTHLGPLFHTEIPKAPRCAIACCSETKRCSSFFDFCLLIPVDMTGLGHTTLSIPHLVRSGQSSSVGRG